MSEGRKSAGAATLEQYTIAEIPASERHGRPRDLFTIWFSSNIMPLTFVTGALAPVVFKLPFGYSVVAILLGNGADISWIVGLVVVIPLYYFVAQARVSHELPATVAVGAPSA